MSKILHLTRDPDDFSYLFGGMEVFFGSAVVNLCSSMDPGEINLRQKRPSLHGKATQKKRALVIGVAIWDKDFF